MRVMAKWSPETERLDAAAELAETIIKSLEITKPPVDPFAIIKFERRLLMAFGDHFGMLLMADLNIRGRNLSCSTTQNMMPCRMSGCTIPGLRSA